MSKLMISSSGLRGIVGEHLTAETIDAFVRAFLKWLPEGKVVIGGDTRTSHDAIAKLIISICQLNGRDVVYIGMCPTPTVQQMVRHHGASGGIAVTASHNPVEWNGIKIINASGSFLSKSEFEPFFEGYLNKNQTEYQSWATVGSYTHDTDAIKRHVDLIEQVLDISSLTTSGLKVLVDVNHGTGALADPILFDRLGVQVDYLYGEPDGKFSHVPEPLAVNLTELCQQMNDGDYDIGFAQDPDADRLVIVDENGRFIGEDYSLAFSMDYYLSQLDQSAEKNVVVNLSTSMIINYIASKYNATLFHTIIGEPNVTEKMRQVNAVIGGEGNGGVILPSVGWGRDSLTGIVLGLLHLASKKQSVSQIIATYPTYVMVRDKQPLESKDVVQTKLDAVASHYHDQQLNSEDGLKVSFDDSWVHIRPSNTEPIVRIFAEAKTEAEANQLVDTVKGL
jgi:phosphomannomutase